jgi:hypothetical protein
MPLENVTTAIERALSVISLARPNWQDDPNLWSAIDLEYIQPVVAPLEAWPTAERLRGKRITDGLGFSSAFDLKVLAQWLVHRSGKVGVAEALNEVDRFIAHDATEMLTVLAVGGIHLERAVQLEPDIVLTPIELLPPSTLRNEALGRIPALAIQMQPLRLRPTAAIAIKYRMAVAFDPRDPPSPELAKAISERETRLTEAQLCLTVAYKGVADLIAAWSQPAEASTPAIFQSAAVSTLVAGSPRRTASQTDHAKAQRILTLFRQFRGDPKSLHVPLYRLNSAMAQVGIVERAIDLGIALEALLMHESGSDKRSSNQEIRFKIGTRGAWLGGGTYEERNVRFTNLRALYGLRSVAVHSGRITTKDARELMMQLDAGEILCAELIERVLELGDWPDWNKLILGYPGA